jgi:large subunit ribosomal protein L25
MAKRDIPEISAQKREKLGTRYAKRLRQQDQLPAVVYGHKQDPVHIAVDRWTLEDMLHSGAHLLKVKLDAHTEPCLIKDVQYDYLSLHPVHADLTRVDMSEEVEVELEVELTGEAAGLSTEGASLDQQLNTLVVKCRADSIPEKVTHDISELQTDQTVTVADLSLPQGVSTDVDPETLVVQIQIMQEEPEEVAEEAAEGEEPEVIGKGEGEEGDAEGEAAGEESAE